jgi:DNA primase
MKRIPEHIIQEVVSRSDIVRVIGEYVRLENRGGRYLGLCPFHNEKTPSFNVHPDKGFFYCFGCKKGGDVISFIKEAEHCGYLEAIERLADKAGITLSYEGEDDPEAQKAARHKDALYELYERLVATVHHLLTDDARGRSALDYARSRGLSDELIARFRLGYLPADRRWLYRFLLSKSYSPEFLKDSGLFSAKYPEVCLFSDRLLFPIEDVRGRVIAFGGRLLAGEGPKYINSPETRLFKKQDNLFGLHASIKGIREQGQALLCEGYMDAIAFHAAGLDYAVAPLGTAFTAQQAALLKRYTPTLVLSFDSDEAGRKAAERSIGIAEAAGLTVKALVLSEGKDPAELMQKYGPERLKKEAESTITADDFLLNYAVQLNKQGGTEGIAAAFAYVFPFMAGFSSALRRDSFLEAAAGRLHVDPASVRSDFDRFLHKRIEPRERERQEPAPHFVPSPDAELLAALAAHPSQFEKARAELDTASFEDEALRDAFIAMEECYRKDDNGLASVLAALQDEGLRNFILERASSGAYEQDPERFIADGVFRIKERSVRKRIRKLVARIRDYDEERDGDETSLNDLLYEKMYLDNELSRIKEERHGRS